MFIPLHDANGLEHIRFQYVTVGLIIANVLVFFATVLGVSEEVSNASVFGLGYIPAVMNDIAEMARRAGHNEAPVLVYDHIGIREAWSAHLQWLDDQIRAVRAIKVSEAGWVLAGWES